MFRRALKTSKNNSLLILGARGTGKSTYIRREYIPLFPHSHVIEIDLLEPEVEDLYLRNPERLKSEISAVLGKYPSLIVFIDEIQKVPRLLDVVHGQIESQKIHFVMTGSSARKLKRGAANLLAGRAFIYSLHPLTSLELGSSFDLETVLEWGSLPKIFSYADLTDRETYLRSYALTYLKEEVQMEQLVRNLDPFREFLEISAQSNGMLLNFTKIARDVGQVDSKTIVSYFQILEDTLLGFFLPSFSKSIRKSQLQRPKFYFFDPGVKRALERTMDVKLKPQTSAFGDAFEHWVILEFFRLNQYLSKDWRLSYFSTPSFEVDLVLSKPKQTILIEIKSSDRIDPVEVEQFAKRTEDFPDAKRFWLSRDSSQQKIAGVLCLPWQEGLNQIFDLAPSQT